jgi:hypothetical protein
MVKKSIPITGLWGPEVSGSLRLPDSVTSALEGGRFSTLRTGRLYPQEYPGTHFNPLNAELNTICHLLSLVGAHHIFHVSRIRVEGRSRPQAMELPDAP